MLDCPIKSYFVTDLTYNSSAPPPINYFQTNERHTITFQVEETVIKKSEFYFYFHLFVHNSLPISTSPRGITSF